MIRSSRKKRVGTNRLCVSRRVEVPYPSAERGLRGGPGSVSLGSDL